MVINTKYIKRNRTEMLHHSINHSVSTCGECDHHNVSKEFVQHKISEHNNAIFAHDKQFNRVYDAIEDVKKMKSTPESLEMIGLDNVKYKLNANLTADVNGKKKQILTSDDDHIYNERFFQQSLEIKDLNDKIDTYNYTFNPNDFIVSSDKHISIKTGEISEDSTQVVTGGDVYSAVSSVGKTLVSFQNFYKQHGFYHFVDCEIIGTDNEITNVSLKPFEVSIIPNNLNTIRINIGSVAEELGDNVVRDLIMIVPSTNTATSIIWPSNIYPKTNPLVDYKCVEGVDNIYWISEFMPDKFVVSGWQAKQS